MPSSACDEIKEIDDAMSFFNDTATTEIYTGEDTLSLHDALPISNLGLLQALNGVRQPKEVPPPPLHQVSGNPPFKT